ncbi:MAG: hypothetical protein JW742_08155, partial [Candidatus Aminicenantes bacterium]|nr:hypothetical protein [Candidatus Aminicenantes bacterium]
AMGLFAAKDGGGLLVGMDWVEDYPWIVRLKKDGTQVWGRVFEAAGSPGEVEYGAASPTRDQGCLIGGCVYPHSGDRLGWFAKVGPTGALKVTRSYVLGGHYYNHFQGMAERLTGGFILVGRSYDSYYSREMWAMTTSTNGLTSPTVKPASFKAVMRTFKLFPYKAGFKVGAGGAAFGPGAFTVVDVSTESKEWAAPTTPPGESARILTGKPGVGRAEFQATPLTLKEMLKARDRKK